MNDNTAQNPNQTNQSPTTSYVDDYQPPAQQPQVSKSMASEPENKEVASDVKPDPAMNIPVNDPVSFDDLIKNSVSTQQELSKTEPVEAKDKVASQIVNDETPEPAVFTPAEPAPAFISNPSASAQVTPESIDKTTSSETLEDQNIFSMLGVDDGTEELKENFLNELQQVIWDDFLENDVDLLITSDEKVKFDEIMAKKDRTDAGQPSKEADDKIQDALVAYLETLIPDLEDIMLEKALDLKADLYTERIIGMKEYHANNSENLATVNTAEKMMHEDKWHSSMELLNKITVE